MKSLKPYPEKPEQFTIALSDAVNEFLSKKHVAIAGVSRNSNEAANLIYRKLKTSGYQVYAVNPKAKEVEGDPCYSGIKAISDTVEAVVIVTPRHATIQVVQECIEAGIYNVWIHRSLMGNSISEEAVQLCKNNGITVIPGGCPMMYCKPVDFGHQCMKGLMKLTGKLPQRIVTPMRR